MFTRMQTIAASAILAAVWAGPDHVGLAVAVARVH